MKGYCKCGKVIDEVEFSQFGMCSVCYRKKDKVFLYIGFFIVLIFLIVMGGIY